MAGLPTSEICAICSCEVYSKLCIKWIMIPIDYFMEGSRRRMIKSVIVDGSVVHT